MVSYMSMSTNQFDFIDIHYHASPDLYKRRYHAFDTGKHYKDLNGAVVLKSHLGSTSLQATLLQKQGLPVFPSVVLNKIAGGIHYRTVIRALAEYNPIIPTKLIVHFPTITGRTHQSRLNRKITHPILRQFTSESETIFDSSKKLRPEIIDILKMACDYPIIVSSGHASKEEVYRLIEASERFRVPSLLLNQPANPLTGFNANDLKALTNDSFLWVEQTALTYLLNYQNKKDFKDVLLHVPNVIYSSDLGQTTMMNIKEWVNCSQQWFAEFKIPIKRREEICLINPLRLLTI